MLTLISGKAGAGHGCIVSSGSWLPGKQLTSGPRRVARTGEPGVIAPWFAFFFSSLVLQDFRWEGLKLLSEAGPDFYKLGPDEANPPLAKLGSDDAFRNCSEKGSDLKRTTPLRCRPRQHRSKEFL